MAIPDGQAMEERVFAFVRGAISSVWELELLLLLYRTPDRKWTPDELVHQLRASHTVVSSALRGLRLAELVAEPERGRFRYNAGVPARDEIVRTLDTAFRTNPISVIKMIAGAPDANLKIFSDAFRFKD